MFGFLQKKITEERNTILVELARLQFDAAHIVRLAHDVQNQINEQYREKVSSY